MKKLFIIVPIVALLSFAIYDIIVEIRSSYTTQYSRTYSRAVGMVMSHRLDSLRLSGRGIRIGVLDAGFGNFCENRWTRSLQVGAYKDFTGGDYSCFFDDPINHGTKVTTNIGGFSGDTIRGLATNATYFLAKTDVVNSELRIEEQQFIRGVEWLIEHDVDIISSSLNYTNFDDFSGYDPQNLDGCSSTLSRYLDSLLSVHPNLLFVQSAGNQGDKDWKYISFPADVQSAITVGSCNSDAVSRDSSSSIGYEQSPYLKPDFVALASPVGTSFSAPIITGLCASLLEQRRLSRDSLVALLRVSGSNSANPDNQIGYGVPQSGYILDRLIE